MMKMFVVMSMLTGCLILPLVPLFMVSQGESGFDSLPMQPGGGGQVPDSKGVEATQWAIEQIGIPYVWGGEAPGVGFDCSGLAQAAYASVGIRLSRTAQGQYDDGPVIGVGSQLQVGDLVFFGASSASVSHVGVYLGISGGERYMVDAAHSGTDVRIEPFPAVVGQWWGGDEYIGATRPDLQA